MKFQRILSSLGMIVAIFYFIHVFLGQILDKTHNPITTDISSLTAVGAPNSELLTIFTTIYGTCLIIFAIYMFSKSFNEYHKITTIGYGFLLIMAILSTIGFYFFPLASDKTALNFQNTMHIAITGITVLLTILYLSLVSYGYLKKDKLRSIGIVSLIAIILILIFGVVNPISIALSLNILGLTERTVIFTLQAYIFSLSFIYTFDFIDIIRNKFFNNNINEIK